MLQFFVPSGVQYSISAQGVWC